MLPNTTLIPYGLVLSPELAVYEIAYDQYVARGAFAGVMSVSGITDYAKFGTHKKRIVLSAGHDTMAGSNKRIPGFLPMLGGPAFGPNALVQLIKYFGWKRVVMYYQNTPDDSAAAETFVTLALGEKKLHSSCNYASRPAQTRLEVISKTWLTRSPTSSYSSEV